MATSRFGTFRNCGCRQPDDQTKTFGCLRCDAARKTFLALASMYESKESIIADRMLRSVETLRLRKEALLVQMEEVLAEAMYELWPDETRRRALRLAAMMAMGTLRFAKDNWRQEDAAHPLTHYIDEAFDLLALQSKRRSGTHQSANV